LGEDNYRIPPAGGGLPLLLFCLSTAASYEVVLSGGRREDLTRREHCVVRPVPPSGDLNAADVEAEVVQPQYGVSHGRSERARDDANSHRAKFTISQGRRVFEDC